MEDDDAAADGFWIDFLQNPHVQMTDGQMAFSCPSYVRSVLFVYRLLFYYLRDEYVQSVLTKFSY